MNVTMYYQYMVLDGRCVGALGLNERGNTWGWGHGEHLGSMSLHTNPLSTLSLVTSLDMILVFL